MARLEGGGRRDMLALAVRLAGADKRLQRQLRRRLTDAARPVADKAKRAIETAPSHHGGLLRAAIAATVRVSVSTSRSRGPSVAIVSDGRKMPPGKERLPVLFDDRGFRHPVFGHDAWVTQRGRPGWFHDTIAREKPAFADAASRALEDAAREVEGR